VGYFDHEDNSMGALTEFLGEKVTLLQGLVGEKLGMIAQAVIASITAIVSLPVAMVSTLIVHTIRTPHTLL
jgi:ATP-binding cassette subfamily B (MDR/TAP) protein 1